MMQGPQRVKDIIDGLTDKSDIDHPIRTKTLNKTLNTLLAQKYLRIVDWWTHMPPDDLANKLKAEEEKKLRGEQSTSASLSAKAIKEATSNAEKRLAQLKEEDRSMVGLKRRASTKVDLETARRNKRRKLDDNSDEEEDAIEKMEHNVLPSSPQNHSRALILDSADTAGECNTDCGPSQIPDISPQ